jgi:hypothetical protein
MSFSFFSSSSSNFNKDLVSFCLFEMGEGSCYIVQAGFELLSPRAPWAGNTGTHYWLSNKDISFHYCGGNLKWVFLFNAIQCWNWTQGDPRLFGLQTKGIISWFSSRKNLVDSQTKAVRLKNSMSIDFYKNVWFFIRSVWWPPIHLNNVVNLRPFCMMTLHWAKPGKGSEEQGIVYKASFRQLWEFSSPLILSVAGRGGPGIQSCLL